MKVDICSADFYIEPENDDEERALEHFFCQNMDYASKFRMKYMPKEHWEKDHMPTLYFTCEIEE